MVRREGVCLTFKLFIRLNVDHYKYARCFIYTTHTYIIHTTLLFISLNRIKYFRNCTNSNLNSLALIRNKICKRLFSSIIIIHRSWYPMYITINSINSHHHLTSITLWCFSTQGSAGKIIQKSLAHQKTRRHSNSWAILIHYVFSFYQEQTRVRSMYNSHACIYQCASYTSIYTKKA